MGEQAIYTKGELVDFLMHEFDTSEDLTWFAVENFYCESQHVRTYRLSIDDAAEFVYSNSKYWTD